MEIEDVVDHLNSLPVAERVPYMQGYLSGLKDEKARREAELVLLVIGSSHNVSLGPKQVVILLHGIRTHGEWQQRVAHELEQRPGVVVYPIQFDRFDLFRFLSPFGTRICRGKPIDQVTRRISQVFARHPADEVCVIAHSFGSYVLTEILKAHRLIRPRRIVLCGCIVDGDFDWELAGASYDRNSVVNDVGSRDIWPVLAKAFGRGYGCTGTFGFGSPLVSDRFHDYRHSDFLTPDHAKRFWLPFVLNGEVVKSEWALQRPTTPMWLSLISQISLFPFLVVLLASYMVGAWLVQP